MSIVGYPKTQLNQNPLINPTGFTFTNLLIFFVVFWKTFFRQSIRGDTEENIYKIANIFCSFSATEKKISDDQREYREMFAIFTPKIRFLNPKIKPETRHLLPKPKKKIKTWTDPKIFFRTWPVTDFCLPDSSLLEHMYVSETAFSFKFFFGHGVRHLFSHIDFSSSFSFVGP